jgi:hypothetical protein
VLKVTCLLPDGIISLPHAFSDTNSVSSIASFCEGFRKLLAVVFEIPRLSLDECTEFIILGLMTTVVQGLLSFHHLEKFWKSSFATFTTTAIAENNHNKFGGNHA